MTATAAGAVGVPARAVGTDNGTDNTEATVPVPGGVAGVATVAAGTAGAPAGAAVSAGPAGSPGTS